MRIRFGSVRARESGRQPVLLAFFLALSICAILGAFLYLQSRTPELARPPAAEESRSQPAATAPVAEESRLSELSEEAALARKSANEPAAESEPPALARAENVTRIFGKVRDGEGNPLSEVHLIFPGVIIGGIVAYALAWFIMPAAPVVETGALASASAAPNGSA